MDDHHGRDRRVLPQHGGDLVGVDAVAPVALHPVDLEPEALGHARQSVAKWPVSKASTRSPGERVLTSAASQAPVPEAG